MAESNAQQIPIDPLWDEVERRSMFDPVLRRLVSVVASGMPREAALISTVLWFADDRMRRQNAEVDRLNNRRS